jgi:hypothetical protein
VRHRPNSLRGGSARAHVTGPDIVTAPNSNASADSDQDYHVHMVWRKGARVNPTLLLERPKARPPAVCLGHWINRDPHLPRRRCPLTRNCQTGGVGLGRSLARRSVWERARDITLTDLRGCRFSRSRAIVNSAQDFPRQRFCQGRSRCGSPSAPWSGPQRTPLPGARGFGRANAISSLRHLPPALRTG